MNTLEHIDTPNKAYIMGLLFADGNSSGNTLALKETDKNILNQIAAYLTLRPPCYVLPSKSRYSTLGLYRISLDNNAQYIRQHWRQGKSCLPLPNQNLISHFVRGLFDGDGCISLDNRYIKKYPGRDHAVPGTFFMLLNRLTHAESIQNILCSELDIGSTKIIEKTGMGNQIIYKICWSGTNTIISIRDWLYRDGEMFLSRKKDIFYEIRHGNRIAAAVAGGNGNAIRAAKNKITWQCRWCGKDKTTSFSRVAHLCSKECQVQEMVQRNTSR